MCKSSHPQIVRAIDLGTHATGLQAQFRQIAVPFFQEVRTARSLIKYRAGL